MVWAYRWKIWVIAPAHNGGCLCIAVKNRQLCSHSLCRCVLIFTAEWHKNCVCTDSWVKSLNKTLLWADVEVWYHRLPAVSSVFLVALRSENRCRDRNVCVLFCTVWVKELSCEVNDSVAAPVHFKSWFSCYSCHHCCLKVFLSSLSHELFKVALCDNNSHSFLWLGDSKFSAVKTVIFLCNGVKVYRKSVSKLADSNWNSACTKVVAAFYHRSYHRVSEQTLKFSFLRCVTLLYLSSAAFQWVEIVWLWRTCCSAAAVTSCSSAKEDNDILRLRSFTSYVLSRSSTYYSTYLHSLCNVARVIYLMNMTGSKTYLVAVWRIAICRTYNDLSLRQLTCDSVLNRNERIACTGYSHCLIYIWTSWQRISDSTAEAGSSTAERLDLCRVVVCFVLEHEQPVLRLAVNVNCYLNRASVYLFALVEVFEQTGFFQLLCTDTSKIHKCNRLVSSACVKVFSCVDVVCKGSSYVVWVDRNVIDYSGECSMTAVVRPVCIYHSYLSDSRISLFNVLEIILTELDIVKVHCKTQVCEHESKVIVCWIDKALNSLDCGRDSILDIKSIKAVQWRLSWFNRVYHIVFYLFKLSLSEFAWNDIYSCWFDSRSFSSGEKWDTLCTGIGSLIELTRQILNCENKLVSLYSREVVIGDVNSRLWENNRCCKVKILSWKAFSVITVYDSQTCKVIKSKGWLDAADKWICLNCKFRLFFYINTVNRHSYISL